MTSGSTDKVFKHRKKLGLKFDGSISTNGYSVTIHFKKPGLKYGYRARKRSKAEMREEVEQLYFEHHIAELREAPNIVSIDLNKRDLLFCRPLAKGVRRVHQWPDQPSESLPGARFERVLSAQKFLAGRASAGQHPHLVLSNLLLPSTVEALYRCRHSTRGDIWMISDGAHTVEFLLDCVCTASEDRINRIACGLSGYSPKSSSGRTTSAEDSGRITATLTRCNEDVTQDLNDDEGFNLTSEASEWAKDLGYAKAGSYRHLETGLARFSTTVRHYGAGTGFTRDLMRGCHFVMVEAYILTGKRTGIWRQADLQLLLDEKDWEDIGNLGRAPADAHISFDRNHGNDSVDSYQAGTSAGKPGCVRDHENTRPRMNKHSYPTITGGPCIGGSIDVEVLDTRTRHQLDEDNEPNNEAMVTIPGQFANSSHKREPQSHPRPKQRSCANRYYEVGASLKRMAEQYQYRDKFVHANDLQQRAAPTATAARVLEERVAFFFAGAGVRGVGLPCTSPQRDPPGLCVAVPQWAPSKPLYQRTTSAPPRFQSMDIVTKLETMPLIYVPLECGVEMARQRALTAAAPTPPRQFSPRVPTKHSQQAITLAASEFRSRRCSSEASRVTTPQKPIAGCIEANPIKASRKDCS
ncbi:uncharacterized protein EV422DRAFT_508810 [Fimicolochytrium jonesii]|uniref:uncharacterized protein n=1 Tax=Fimicolochytrium jonesii TaxID=1396493 RepID=UPI0022FDC519|nr:uncharacterized protein EV422DRAFT_508810 [Fimicolochytrium jonesii]KAI8817742.1 hypothetical protein EV422DRAFT_508810 [Fimicolochytrium jonesii]